MNRSAIIQGWLDTPLNALGLAQAVEVGRHFEEMGISFDACYSSDLVRAADTARIVLDRLGSSIPVQTDARLRERYLGSLQGKPYGSRNVGDQEPLEPYRGRLLSYYDQLLSDTTTSQTVLVTSHGGPIKQLVPALCRLRDVTFAPGVDATAARVYNCSVTHIRSRKETHWSGVIERYADVSFFPEPAKTSGAAGDAEAVEHTSR